MQWLWGMVNTMQLITHMPLIQVLLPPNCITFFQILIGLSTIELVPVDEINDYLFSSNEIIDP